MLLQALIGLLVLIQFNRFTVITGLASLLVVAIYPFMKRITYWPQIVLGLAFSYGALMGWPAAFGRLDWPAIVLYAGSISWVIGYDTIYAHQDREDDLLIGIKSTALLFGENTRPMLAGFYAGAVVLIGAAGLMAGGGLIFVLGLIAFAAHLAWQVVRLDINDSAHCLKLFKSNRDAGLILFARDAAGSGVLRQRAVPANKPWSGFLRDEWRHRRPRPRLGGRANRRAAGAASNSPAASMSAGCAFCGTAPIEPVTMRRLPHPAISHPAPGIATGSRPLASAFDGTEPV